MCEPEKLSNLCPGEPVAVTERFPSKSALRDQRRKEQETEAVAREQREADLDREQNWQKYYLLDKVHGLSDVDESMSTITDALTYLLERAHD